MWSLSSYCTKTFISKTTNQIEAASMPPVNASPKIFLPERTAVIDSPENTSPTDLEKLG